MDMSIVQGLSYFKKNSACIKKKKKEQKHHCHPKKKKVLHCFPELYMEVMSVRHYWFWQPPQLQASTGSLEEFQMESITIYFDVWESLDIDLRVMMTIPWEVFALCSETRKKPPTLLAAEILCRALSRTFYLVRTHLWRVETCFCSTPSGIDKGLAQ